MNRRGFLGRVVAGAAGAAVVKALPADAAAVMPAAVPAESTLTEAVAKGGHGRLASAGVETVRSYRPFYEDRLTLLQLRGLLAPCPNCGTVNWRESGGNHLACNRCAWIVRRSVIEQPCQCEECRLPHWMITEPAKRGWATRECLQFDAAPGAYYVEALSTPSLLLPVIKYEANHYDICRDDYDHDVTLQQVARVVCAVKALSIVVGGGYERLRQPSGNFVVLGWEVLDSHERRVQRGEAIEALYQRDEHGRVTLVQPIRRVRA